MNQDESTEKRVYARVSESFHRRVRIKALQKGKTVEQVIRSLLEKWLEESEGKVSR